MEAEFEKRTASSATRRGPRGRPRLTVDGRSEGGREFQTGDGGRSVQNSISPLVCSLPKRFVQKSMPVEIAD